MVKSEGPNHPTIAPRFTEDCGRSMERRNKQSSQEVRVTVLRGTRLRQGANMVVGVQNDNYDKGGEPVYTLAFKADEARHGKSRCPWHRGPSGII